MKPLLFLLLFSAAGCAAVVTPPEKINDSVPVYLATYNVHSTVIMPHNGKFIDFAFGDWGYAALHHKFINDALGALTFSGSSAFERRFIDMDPHTGAPILYDNPDMVIRLYANRDLVNHRVGELEHRFEEDLAEHKTDGMMTYRNGIETYVKDPQHYSLTNNCNHMTAATLRSLGYTVDGPTISNEFHIASAHQK